MPALFDLSIIIPAYKEGAEFAQHLETLAAWLKTHDYGRVEVLVLSDGDQSSGQMAESKAGLFNHLRAIYPGTRMGKGGAVRLGMFEATGKYRLFMDADLATPLRHLDDVQALIKQDAKVIIAVRDLLKIHKGLLRKFMSKFGNLVAQVLLTPGIQDTQCGFKAFEAEAAEAIFGRQTMTGWSFDVEVLKIARLLGYKISCIEAPDWHDPKVTGLVGDSPLKAAIDTFVDMFIILFNSLKGQYRHTTFKHKSYHGN